MTPIADSWLTKYGKDLKGICASGNSKQGMDFVKEGKLFGISYQTAEGGRPFFPKPGARRGEAPDRRPGPGPR